MKDAAVNQRQLPKSKADMHKNDKYTWKSMAIQMSRDKADYKTHQRKEPEMDSS